MEGSRLSNKNNKKTQFLVHMQKGEFKNLCYTYLSGNCQWVCLCSGLYPYICTHVYVYMYLSLCPCVYVLLAKNSWHSCRTRPTLIASQRSITTELQSSLQTQETHYEEPQLNVKRHVQNIPRPECFLFFFRSMSTIFFIIFIV